MAYTQNQSKQPPPLTLNKVKDDLYEIEGDGGNVAVYVTGEGLVLVDDKFEQEALPGQETGLPGKRFALTQNCRKDCVQSFDGRIADRYLSIDNRIDDQGRVLSDFGESVRGPISPTRIVRGD